MKSDWAEMQLGDALTLQRGYDLPVDKRMAGHVPVIASTGPVGFHNEAKVKAPGVVIGRSGSIGGGQFIQKDFWPLNTTLWVKDFKANSPRFCYYLLISIKFSRFNVGSGVPTLNRNHIHPLPIKLPPLPEQRAIAHILGTLDDKIELNRKMNETLEAMARAIFKSWFVDFLPVRAKTEGRDTGLPKEIADLFPDSFENSELGEIPKGWRVENLGEVVTLAYGKALKKAIRMSGNIPVYGSNGQVGWHNEKLVDGPGIIVGRKGNPGIITWVPTDFFPIDTTFYVVPKGPISSLYYLFYSLGLQDLPSLGADSAVPGLNRNMAYMNHIIIPPIKILQLFDTQVDNLYKKIQANNDQSTTLSAIRDALLHKLISGEIRVTEAERIMELTS